MAGSNLRRMFVVVSVAEGLDEDSVVLHMACCRRHEEMAKIKSPNKITIVLQIHLQRTCSTPALGQMSGLFDACMVAENFPTSLGLLRPGF